jgi:hypothetical protein
MEELAVAAQGSANLNINNTFNKAQLSNSLDQLEIAALIIQQVMELQFNTQNKSWKWREVI